MFASALVGRWLSKGPSERSLPLAGYLCSCKQTTDKSDREKARKRIENLLRNRASSRALSAGAPLVQPTLAATRMRGRRRRPSPVEAAARAKESRATGGRIGRLDCVLVRATSATQRPNREREPRRSTGRSRRLASERPMPMSARSCACLRVCACERFPSLCEQQVH